MKELSRGKVLKWKVSQNDPQNPSRWIHGPGGQRDQGHGVVLHDQEEVYQPHITSISESSQVPQGVNDVFNDQIKAPSTFKI